MLKQVDKKYRIRTLDSKDPDWFISADNFSVTPRASFQIAQGCPVEYARIISECIQVGWLKPIAHMKESEYMWEKLGD